MGISQIIAAYGPGLAVSGIVATLLKSKTIILLCLRSLAVVGDMAGKIYYRWSGAPAITPGQSDLPALGEILSQVESVVSQGTKDSETH